MGYGSSLRFQSMVAMISLLFSEWFLLATFGELLRAILRLKICAALEEIIENSRAQYAKHGIPTSDKKAFEKAGNFVAWGTEVDSQSGRVGTPLSKLRQLGRVIAEVRRKVRGQKQKTRTRPPGPPLLPPTNHI